MTFCRTHYISTFARTTSGSIWLSFSAARTLAITTISLCKRIYHCLIRFVLLYKKICIFWLTSEFIIQLRNNGGLYRPSNFRQFPNRFLLCAAGVRTMWHCSFKLAHCPLFVMLLGMNNCIIESGFWPGSPENVNYLFDQKLFSLWDAFRKCMPGSSQTAFIRSLEDLSLSKNRLNMLYSHWYIYLL